MNPAQLANAGQLACYTILSCFSLVSLDVGRQQRLKGDYGYGTKKDVNLGGGEATASPAHCQTSEGPHLSCSMISCCPAVMISANKEINAQQFEMLRHSRSD